MELESPDIAMDPPSPDPPLPRAQAASFTMGRVPTVSRRERRNKPKHKAKKIHIAKSTKKVAGFPFPLSRTKHYGFPLCFTLASFPRSSVQAVRHLHTLIAPPVKPNYFTMKPDEVKELCKAFFENIRARWAFRKLLLIWKLRRCKPKNENDPMTLDTIKDLVEIIDLPTKSIYRFEAKSLARAWRSNLLNHDGVFPDPKMPINPLTNLPFHLLQVHSALKTIKQKGQTDWVLDSFQSTTYDLDLWQRKFSVPLKIESLNSILADKSSYDRYDILMDFAELQYDYHNISFPKKMFEWLFLKHHTYDYINSWVRACKKFYTEKYMLTEKDDLDDLDVRSSVINAYLTEIPSDIQEKYNEYLERLHGVNVSRRPLQNRVIVRAGISSI